MPLQEQQIEVSLASGLAQGVNEKLVPDGRLLTVVNGEWTKDGELGLRNGYVALSADNARGADTEVLTTGAKLATNRRGELLLIDGVNIWSYLDAEDQWVRQDKVSQWTVTEGVVSNDAPEDAGYPDMATLLGYDVFAWIRGNSGGFAEVRASVVERSSGSVAWSSVLLSTATKDAERVQCVAAGSNVIVLWANATDGTIQCMRISLASVGTGFFGLTTVATPTTPGTNIVFDADSIRASNGLPGTEFLLVYQESLSTLIIRRYSSSVVMAATRTITMVGVPPFDVTTLAIIGTTGGRGYVAWHETLAIRCEVFDHTSGTLANVAGPTLVSTTTALGGIAHLALCRIALTNALVFWNDGYTSIPDRDMRWRKILDTGALTGVEQFCFSVHALGKPVHRVTVKNEDQVYLPCLYTQNANPTGLLDALADTDAGRGHCFLRLQVEDFASAVSKPQPVAAISPGELVAPRLSSLPSRTHLASAAIATDDVSYFLGTVQRLGGAKFHTFRDTAEENDTRWLSVEIADGLYLSGGQPMAWDGFQLAEHLYHWSSDLTVGSKAGGPLTPGGIYLYAVTYSWIDRYGQRHESAPEGPTSATVGGGHGQFDVTLTDLTVTSKVDVYQDFAGSIKIRIWRSQANSSTLHLVTELDNDIQATAVRVYTDAATDASIADNPLLYTNGDVQANDLVGSARALVAHKGRLWLTDGRNLYYSQKFLFGEIANTSLGLALTVPEGDDDITALASLDEALVVFKRDQIFAVYGDGPEPTGAPRDAFTEARRVASDEGTVSPASVVSTPQGVMFQAAESGVIHLLDRGLQVIPVGKDVEDLTAVYSTVLSADLLAKKNQVRFLCSSGDLQGVLVYDYFRQLWAGHDVTGVDAVVRGGDYYVLGVDGVVKKETEGIYDDDGDFYAMEVTSAWQRFGDLQGFKRLWGVGLLGELKDKCGLMVELGYDYDADFPVGFVLEPAEVESHVKETTGLVRGKIQMTFPNPIQQVSSARVRVTTMAKQDGAATQGVTLTGLAFSWGKKSGIVQTRAVQPRGP